MLFEATEKMAPGVADSSLAVGCRGAATQRVDIDFVVSTLRKDDISSQ